jgi:hypothetical protein
MEPRQRTLPCLAFSRFDIAAEISAELSAELSPTTPDRISNPRNRHYTSSIVEDAEMPNYAWYKSAFLTPSKNYLKADAVKGPKISDATYYAWLEFCKAKLTTGGVYKLNMKTLAAVWRKGEILQAGEKDNRFSFLLDNKIPRAWFDWTLNSIFSRAAELLNRAAPTKRKWRNDVAEATSNATRTRKKRKLSKLSPEQVTINIEFVDSHNVRGEEKVAITELIKSPYQPLVGGKVKTLNYQYANEPTTRNTQLTSGLERSPSNRSATRSLSLSNVSSLALIVIMCLHTVMLANRR